MKVRAAVAILLMSVSACAKPVLQPIKPDLNRTHVSTRDQGGIAPSPGSGSSLSEPGQPGEPLLTESGTKPSPKAKPRNAVGEDGSPPGSATCPNPKTCEIYRFNHGPEPRGWPRGSDGLVHIPYWINSKPPESTAETPVTRIDLVRPEEIKRAILDSVAVWEAASPILRFELQGETDREPITRDGMTVFSFGMSAEVQRDPFTGYFIEADIHRGKIVNSVSYDRCEQRDGACTNTGKRSDDIGNIIVHELGHVLGLADLGSGDGPDAYLMTMNTGSSRGDLHQEGERLRSTLALGDVLGIRQLYPCSCPMPEIFSP